MNRSRRAELDRIVDRLPIPQPWSVEAMCVALADVRGRKVTLAARPAADHDGVYAAVMSTEDADHIFVRDDLRGVHRDQAICHEFGHLLARHAESTPMTPLTYANPVLLGHLFNRSCAVNDATEEEAEYVGHRILERASRRRLRGSDALERGFGDLLT